MKGAGQRPEEAGEDEDGERQAVRGVGDDEAQAGVEQPHRPELEEERHDRELGGDGEAGQDQTEDEPARGMIEAGERIGRHRHQGHDQGDGAYRHQDGIEEILAEVRLVPGPRVVVGLQRPERRQREGVAEDLVIRLQRGVGDPDHREDEPGGVAVGSGRAHGRRGGGRGRGGRRRARRRGDALRR